MSLAPRGSGPALQDFLAGRFPVMTDSLSVMAPSLSEWGLAAWARQVSSGTYKRPRDQSMARSCQKFVNCSAVHSASDDRSSRSSS